MTSPESSLHCDLAHYPNLLRHRERVLEQLQTAGTPVFLCDRGILVDRYQELTRSLTRRWGPFVVGYSFKTNYLVAKTRIFQELGAWAEVVSAREYDLARDLGFGGPEIIFNGPLKPESALQAAIADGALINVNDHDELDRLLKLVQDRPTTLEIGLRISSTLPRLGHSRFGFSLENDEAKTAAEKVQASQHVRLVALHTHLYGDTDTPETYGLAAARLGEFAKQHLADYERTLKYVDLGGGFPAHSPKPKSRTEWAPQAIDVYVCQIASSLREYFPDSEARPTLVVEPGRYLTCDGIVLVTQVVHVKWRDGQQYVNCDGSISMVPLTHYCPQIIRAYSPELTLRDAALVDTVIQGSTCRENDLLYQGTFPTLHTGDYLVHYAAGAYNSSLSPDFIFASPAMNVLN